MDKSFAGRSKDFSLVQMLASSSINIRALTIMTKASWWVDKWPPGLTSI